MVLILVNYIIKIMTKMMDKLLKYRNPYYHQYVASYGYHFERNGENLGRILWIKNTDGITIEKDED